MCGIVGYLGPRNPKDVIVDGLKCLEYRGYDSAGIAILEGKKFKRIRAKGKLSALQAKLEGETFTGHLGIGHTRWATHGVPSERNAHPHESGGVTLVHNGIIENYLDIREDLLSKGVKIESDTDSELVAHVIREQVEKTRDLAKAVREVASRFHGAFAIVVAWDQQPDTLVAFKNGPPLILGVSNEEMILASDIQAIVPYTRTALYLDDGEVVEVRKGAFHVWKGHQEIQRQTVEVDWTQQRAERQGYPHFMLKEIFEQPRAVAAALEPVIDVPSQRIQLDLQFSDFKRILVVACGTSYYAGLAAEYLFEKMARIPTEVEYASEFRYRSPILEKGTLAIVISQSGETADTLAALRLIREQGLPALDICNVKNSTIDRESQYHLYMRAGPEVGVASTKALTCTLALLNVLAIKAARDRGMMSAEEERKQVESLLAVPSLMEQVLNHDKFFAESALTLKAFKGFLYIGRGIHFPVALEGALKLKELAYMHAEGYAAGEMKHGPIALIDSNMAVVVLAPSDDVYEKTVSNLEEVRARGGQIISLGTGPGDRLSKLSLHYLSLPEVSWNLSPLVSVIPMQLLAYHVANALGYDVDQPRNLAKSVTVE